MPVEAMAGVMAVQRVDSGNHWASDCFIPAVTGTLTARTVIHRNAERRAAEQGRPTATLLPYITPDGAAGLMLAARF